LFRRHLAGPRLREGETARAVGQIDVVADRAAVGDGIEAFRIEIEAALQDRHEDLGIGQGARRDALALADQDLEEATLGIEQHRW
jgi:hypothetical protein